MSKQAYSVADDGAMGRELVPAEAETQDTDAPQKARPIPRISIQAFCEDPKTAEVLQAATADRRLAKSHVSVHMGGAPAAVAHRCCPSSTGLPNAATQEPRSSSSAT
jgi:hypothetical protein